MGHRYGPLLVGKRENMAFGMQQFGAALGGSEEAKVSQTEHRTAYLSVGIALLSRKKICIRHGGDSQHDAGRSGQTTRHVSSRGENMVGAREPCAPVIRLT